MRTLRDDAQPIYLSLRFGEPMPLWAVHCYVADMTHRPLAEIRAWPLEDLSQYLAVRYATSRADGGEVMTLEEDIIRACHAAVSREMEGADA